MYDYIQISKLNDFIFCPYSLYFHGVYEGFDNASYKEKPQIAGTIAHENIDLKKYSSEKDCLQGLEVFSEQYGIIGKIDIYDKKKKHLVERKRKINRIYDGYIYQLYAQKLCLEEMGYEVKSMAFYSLMDNKSYKVEVDGVLVDGFLNTLEAIRNFDPLNVAKNIITAKCNNCIYRELCKKYDTSA